MNNLLSRRDFLRLIGGIGAAFTLSSCTSANHESHTSEGSEASHPSQEGLIVSPVSPKSATSSFVPDVEIALRAIPSEVTLFSGQASQVWTYQGELLKGDPSTLQFLDGSYLGPIIRLRTGQKVRINFTNELDSESIIHWHGLHLPHEADGHPSYAIPKGESYVYEFEVRNRAGTYWYHPHPHGQTGAQVYQGLAGLLLISDDEEDSLALPSDEYDVPLVIQDRIIDSNNQFVYTATEMMTQMMGVLGDKILINGQADFSLSVATRAYRIRLLNGSNSRIYKLAWDDKTPLTVIASDGGLLEEAIQREYVTLSPAERIELWVDFSDYPVGTTLQLMSLSFTGVEMGQMMGQMMGHSVEPTVPNGESFSVLTVNVERGFASFGEEPETLTLPKQLSVHKRHNPADALKTRTFRLSMKDMNWTINGNLFEMEKVTEEETVKLGTTEVWEFINEPGTGHMADFMAHPIHIHGLQFQVLERQITDSELKANWETLSAGYVDEGWKDTVLVMPGEQVKLLLNFSDYEGLFIYHCHNLEHEDMGMMRNYLVQA